MVRIHSLALRFGAVLTTLLCAAAIPAQTSVMIHDVMQKLPGGPYLGQSVSTSGIVVGVLSGGGFYLSEPSSDWDNLVATAEGMPVFASAVGTCANVADGDVLTVVGTVVNGTEVTAANTPGTGIQPTSCTKTSTAAMTQSIDLANFGALTSFGDALKFTGMAATDRSFVAVAPTGGNLSSTATGIASTGQFWAVLSSNITTDNHMFRAAGIAADEYTPSGAPSGVPTWNGNPQRILIDTTTFGGTAVDITVGQTITCSNSNSAGLGATAGIGLIDYTLGYARLLIFKETTCSVSGTVATSVSAVADTTHFKVGTLDVNTFLGSASLFPTALAKATLTVTGVFGSPDILALQQVGDQTTLQSLATSVNAANSGSTNYVALVNGTDTVNSGFLVNGTTLRNAVVNEVGRGTTYSGGTLWQHPPLVLTGEFQRTGKNYPVTVINVDFLPRDNSGDATLGADVRAHRAAQAAAVSQFVQQYQSAGANVIVAGNFNAYEYNDGYVDVVGIVQGTPAASTAVTTYQATSTTAVLTDFTTSVDSGTRYNVIERGNAASIEHILASSTVTDATTASGSLASYIHLVTQPHFSTDYAAVTANDASTPAGLTPHDGFLVNFAIPPVPTVATLAPTALNFGNVAIDGGTATLPITFTNTSSFSPATINVSKFAFTGTNAAEFTESDNCTEVTQGQTCTINVTFSPLAIGTRTATLTVTSDSTSEPALTASLTGNGIDTNATLTPASATFAQTYAGGGISAAQTFTFSNTSSVALPFKSALVTANFNLVTNNCPASVAAGASCTLLVTFTPTVAGALTGTLTVTNGSSANGTLVAALNGTGLPTTATLSPATQSFGNVLLGSTSAVFPFTYTNTSAVALTVTGATATGDYRVSSNGCASVAAKGSCVIGVVLTPTLLGTRTGALTVSSSASANPTLTSALTGRGVADVETSASALDFGTVDVGFHSTAQVVTVTNYTAASISLTGLTLAGEYADTTTCGGTLPGLSSCTVSIVFSPTAIGPRPGSLTITTNDTKYPVLSVALTGSGTDFGITVLPVIGDMIAGNGTMTAKVTTTALGGFDAPVTLTCTFLAVGSTCTLPTPTFVLTGTTKQDMAITTTGQYTLVGYGLAPNARGASFFLWIASIAGALLMFRGCRQRRLPNTLLLVALLFLLATGGLTGCSGKYPELNSPYTAPGTYTYTVTATDGNISHSATYTLTVRQRN